MKVFFITYQSELVGDVELMRSDNILPKFEFVRKFAVNIPSGHE